MMRRRAFPVACGGANVQSFIERFLLACRWLLIPLYILLALSLLELTAQTALKAYSVAVNFWSLGGEAVLLSVLGIVDLTLTASLVVIVFISGYANFIAPVLMHVEDGLPQWIVDIDFGEVKVKLLGSIVAISAVKLLESFMEVSQLSDRELGWTLGIHLAFVASAVLLAVADNIGRRSHSGGGEGV
jgi:uncharacterized protein (TIGR00645 family)